MEDSTSRTNSLSAVSPANAPAAGSSATAQTRSTLAWLSFCLALPTSTRLCQHARLSCADPAHLGNLIQHYVEGRDTQLERVLEALIPAQQLQQLFAADTQRKVNEALHWQASAEQHHIIGLDHPAYPALLQNISDSPPLLYASGNLSALNRPLVGVVGSRKASYAALAHTRTLSAELAAKGIGIVSGLALGIDAAAHEGALDAGGITLAVAATGPDKIYPKRHAALAQRILDNDGLILFENPIGSPTLPWHFPQRNRIISGMSQGVLIAEAGLPSGTMTTATHAMNQGREVMAVPGSVQNLQVRGCHALIKQGAALVESVDDVMDVLGQSVHCLPKTPLNVIGTTQPHQLDLNVEELNEVELALLQCLSAGPATLDELMAQSESDIIQLSSTLGLLEIRGIIRTCSGGRYARC